MNEDWTKNRINLQVLRGRPVLPVRQQDPVRVRLRGAHGLRQPRLQLQQPRPDEEPGHQGHRAPAPASAATGLDGRTRWKGTDCQKYFFFD